MSGGDGAASKVRVVDSSGLGGGGGGGPGEECEGPGVLNSSSDEYDLGLDWRRRSGSFKFEIVFLASTAPAGGTTTTTCSLAGSFQCVS